jgi:hypothetical protein
MGVVCMGAATSVLQFLRAIYHRSACLMNGVTWIVLVI